MKILSIRIDRDQIAYLKWLLESHDGMATPTTRDGTEDIIDLLIAPDFTRDLDDLLSALALEILIERVDPPDAPPLGG